VIKTEQTIARGTEMLKRVSLVMETLTAHSSNPVPVFDADTGDELEDVAAQNQDQVPASHRHHTLKTSVCTRWNSTLTMIESVLDLLKPALEALKKIGKSELCLEDDDAEI
jgi:hypothetical protein